MLPVSWDTVRLFLHVLAATVWLGGQLVLAALVPALRRFGTDVLGTAAPRSADRSRSAASTPEPRTDARRMSPGPFGPSDFYPNDPWRTDLARYELIRLGRVSADPAVRFPRDAVRVVTALPMARPWILVF